MRIALACFLSAILVALVIGSYSIFESGFSVMTFGVTLIAFVYALALAFIFGLPLLFLLKKTHRIGRIYFGISGAIIGAAFMIAPMVRSRGSDVSAMKLALVLTIAGFCSGLIFRRVAIGNV
jgi:hypothetical protein